MVTLGGEDVLLCGGEDGGDVMLGDGRIDGDLWNQGGRSGSEEGRVVCVYTGVLCVSEGAESS